MAHVCHLRTPLQASDNPQYQLQIPKFRFLVQRGSWLWNKLPEKNGQGQILGDSGNCCSSIPLGSSAGKWNLLSASLEISTRALTSHGNLHTQKMTKSQEPHRDSDFVNLLYISDVLIPWWWATAERPKTEFKCFQQLSLTKCTSYYHEKVLLGFFFLFLPLQKNCLVPKRSFWRTLLFYKLLDFIKTLHISDDFLCACI